jgi:hypothetical protein
MVQYFLALSGNGGTVTTRRTGIRYRRTAFPICELETMRARARQTGGKFDIWSKAGAGAEIELTIAGSVA